MSEDLLSVSLSGESNQLINRLSKLSPDLGNTVRQIAQNAVRGVTQLGLAAYKSKIPIDTLALRGRGLDDGFLAMEISSSHGRVFIREGIHTNRYGKKQSSTGLADILNRGSGHNGGVLHRSQDSAALGVPDSDVSPYGQEKRGTETADWEGKAFRAFVSPAKLGAYLKNTDFLKDVR